MLVLWAYTSETTAFRRNYCRTSGNSSDSLAAIAFGANAMTLIGIPDVSFSGRCFRGHRHANVVPLFRCSVVLSAAPPAAPPSRHRLHRQLQHQSSPCRLHSGQGTRSTVTACAHHCHNPWTRMLQPRMLQPRWTTV